MKLVRREPYPIDGMVHVCEVDIEFGTTGNVTIDETFLLCVLAEAGYEQVPE